MINNSAASPLGARTRTERLFAGALGAGEPEEARADAGLTAACCPFSQCRPTPTAWAQIFPHSRASRQPQRFSISVSLFTTRDARKDISPDWTTPRSSGGVQLELS